MELKKVLDFSEQARISLHSLPHLTEGLRSLVSTAKAHPLTRKSEANLLARFLTELQCRYYLCGGYPSIVLVMEWFLLLHRAYPWMPPNSCRLYPMVCFPIPIFPLWSSIISAPLATSWRGWNKLMWRPKTWSDQDQSFHQSVSYTAPVISPKVNDRNNCNCDLGMHLEICAPKVCILVQEFCVLSRINPAPWNLLLTANSRACLYRRLWPVSRRKGLHTVHLLL